MSNSPSHPVVPSQAEIQQLIGLLGAGKLDEAIAFGEPLARENPGSILLCQVIGAANIELKRHHQAALWFERALQINPNAPEVLFNLGVAKQELDRSDEAIACYERVIGLRPDYAEAHHNLGAQLFRLGRKAEAIGCYRRAIAVKSDYAEAHFNLGIALQGQREYGEAIAAYRRALAINPDHADAYRELGMVLQTIGRLEEALNCYQRSLQLKPEDGPVRALYLHMLAHICDWDTLGTLAAEIPQMGVVGEAVTPFSLLSFEDDPERQRLRAERYGLNYMGEAVPVEIGRPRAKPERLRIGYFSSDFWRHATMYLMAGLFEAHDRERFSIHIFSYGSTRNDDMRQRLRDIVDGFHDVASLSDAEAAELARREGIDIAIDLKGYTGQTRLGIFAWRPAPIQVAYLGYPGTTGVPFIDYLIADKMVIPAEQRSHFTEKIIYLPGSYQVNDNRRLIADRPAGRAEAGLPDRGFVFCCFNNSYKITPAEFGIWMRLLHRVDGSVLWLLGVGPRAMANLRREAERCGIAIDRLIFAPRLPQAEHLARQRHADLFLDTFNVNAHTTTSDALWAGLPVLTMAGRGFAARVAASLLRAVGLPELIVETPEDYERLALDLATDPLRLAEIRQKLATNRMTKPLFDTQRFARKIEVAYQQAYDAWFEGSDGGDITID